ncbi:hypothetical protein GARC_4533 [Paraglaciecola arctica BSs20135]|uniref:Uncharacterized protein n=1 Tax=Paraglaciecola arctica BSs20135 TaxID=493475 RepID=K6ZDI0_9ALTE|nr:hypothetical protein GARC_4533 [Paraglaciecola arctica BSs20135]
MKESCLVIIGAFFIFNFIRLTRHFVNKKTRINIDFRKHHFEY